MRAELMPDFVAKGGVVGIILIPQTPREEQELETIYNSHSHLHLCCKAFVTEQTSPTRRSRRRRLWLMQSAQKWIGKL